MLVKPQRLLDRVRRRIVAIMRPVLLDSPDDSFSRDFISDLASIFHPEPRQVMQLQSFSECPDVLRHEARGNALRLCDAHHLLFAEDDVIFGCSLAIVIKALG